MWQFKNQMMFRVFLILGSGKPRLSGGGKLYGTFPNHASKTLHFGKQMWLVFWQKYVGSVLEKIFWKCLAKFHPMTNFVSRVLRVVTMRSRWRLFFFFSFLLAHHSFLAQVKVATVRKDNTALMENFPLHITIGPKVGWVLFCHKMEFFCLSFNKTEKQFKKQLTKKI